MGRPAKVQETAADKGVEKTMESIAKVVAKDLNETAKKAFDAKSLKLCPKCGDKTDGPHKDPQGNWRCNCSHPKCGFWDSMVYNTADEAAAGWEAAGGPERYE